MKKLFLLIIFLALCVPVYGQMGRGAFNDTDKWTSSGDDIYRTNGNVGIGTSAPSGILEIGDNKLIYCDVFTGEGIQLCITALGSDGGTVKLLEGSYITSGDEINIITSNVTLEGTGRNTIINNTSTDGKTAVRITGINNDSDEIDNVNIKNLQIKGAVNGGHGIRAVAADFLYLTNLNINNSGLDGIFTDTCEENLIISDCDISYNNRYGICIRFNHDSLINNCQIEENSDDAIYITDSFNIHVVNCLIDDSLSRGISLINSRLSVISSCTIEENDHEAIYMSQKGENLIIGNTISSNSNSLPTVFIDDDCHWNTFVGNSFSGDGTKFKIKGDYNLINSNNWDDFEYAGWSCDGVHLDTAAEYNLIEGNHFYRMDNYGVYCEGNNNYIKNNIFLGHENGGSPLGADLIVTGQYCTIKGNIGKDTGSQTDYGLVLYGEADYNKVIDNWFYGYQIDNIAIVGANNEVRGNIDSATGNTFNIIGDVNIDDSSWTLTTTHQYKMNDNASNTTVTDEQGANGISSQNTDVMSTTGKVDTALSFNGTTDRIVVSSDIIGSGAASVCAWIYPIGWGEGGFGRIIDNQEFMFHVVPTKMKSHLNNCSASNSIILNDWQFVCLTAAANGNLNFYIDGLLSGDSNQVGGVLTGGENTYIGDRNDETRSFNGYIDNLMVFSSELSATDISNLSATTSHDEILTDGKEYGLNVSGSIGIGITTPTADLDIGGGSATTIDGTDDILVKDALEVDGTIYGDVGIRPGLVTSDPCGVGYPEGALFYNNTSDYFCFCDGSGVDKKVSDNGACF